MADGSSIRFGSRQTAGIRLGDSSKPKFTATQLSDVKTVRRNSPLAGNVFISCLESTPWFRGLLVRPVHCFIAESLRESNVAPVACVIDRCPLYMITVLYTGPVFEKNVGDGGKAYETYNDKWSPILG